MRKTILSITLTFFILLCFSVPAFASVTRYVVQGSDSTVLEYDYAELDNSYTGYLFGMEAKLYMDYAAQTGGVIALYDSTRGYVEYASIDAAYTESLIMGTPFSLDEYIQNSAVPANLPATMYEVFIGEDGEVKRTLKTNNSTIKSFATYPSLQLGKLKVMVELNTNNPEQYQVTCANVELIYDATSNCFIGDVDAEQALESNVVVTEINTEDFYVVGID